MTVHAFYNALSDKLGLPREASIEGWSFYGRKIVGRMRHIERGWPIFGIEATVEEKPASMTPTLDKLEAERDFADEIDDTYCIVQPGDEVNAAMIARDGPAKPKLVRFNCVDCRGCDECAPASTAKPAIAAFTRSPDLKATSLVVYPHLASPQHGTAHKLG